MNGVEQPKSCQSNFVFMMPICPVHHHNDHNVVTQFNGVPKRAVMPMLVFITHKETMHINRPCTRQPIRLLSNPCTNSAGRWSHHRPQGTPHPSLVLPSPCTRSSTCSSHLSEPRASSVNIPRLPRPLKQEPFSWSRSVFAGSLLPERDRGRGRGRD